MLSFHIIIVLLFLGMGIYYLFFANAPVEAIHYLLIALYFFVTMFEMRGRPFSKNIYLLVLILLVADGVINLFIFPVSLLSGIFSFFLAFLTWQTFRRLQNR